MELNSNTTLKHRLPRRNKIKIVNSIGLDTVFLISKKISPLDSVMQRREAIHECFALARDGPPWPAPDPYSSREIEENYQTGRLTIFAVLDLRRVRSIKTQEHNDISRENLNPQLLGLFVHLHSIGSAWGHCGQAAERWRVCTRLVP